MKYLSAVLKLEPHNIGLDMTPHSDKPLKIISLRISLKEQTHIPSLLQIPLSGPPQF